MTRPSNWRAWLAFAHDVTAAALAWVAAVAAPLLEASAAQEARPTRLPGSEVRITR